ncbi:MAG TPA: Gfo/Idh/MocA family oxidoreductase [Phycisphaerae bacterium]|nr:Gfo/Idh/MocA family oxidoreductase [Phycisphaerae bacterium]
MSDRKLGVLVHGAGWVSAQHIQAFANNPHAEVVAISSRKIESARRRAAEAGLDVPCYDDYEKALAHKGVDVVSVCTPQHVHAANTIAAARAGKHVVIEKPVAIDLDQLAAMRDAVRAAKVRTVVSFVLRWNPLFETVKAMIADDAVGEVFCVETAYEHYCGPWWTGWDDARRADTGRSAFLVGGCHAIDALRWFAARGRHEAATPVEVFAWSGGRRKGEARQYNHLTNAWSDEPPMEYDGLEIALVRFDNGVLGKVAVNFECIQPYTFPVAIFGDKGTVRNNRVWSHKYPGQTGWVELPCVLPDSADVSHHPFQGQIDHFVDCVLSGVESHCNLDDAVKTHEVAFAALECYATGRPVKLPLI